MKNTFLICAMCGNSRQLLEKICPFCGEKDVLHEQKNHWDFFTINLESGLPRVEEAMQRFENQLEQLTGSSIRMLQVIHGQGSQGEGRIKKAFREAMQHGRWHQIISAYYFGEHLKASQTTYQFLIKQYPAIKTVLKPEMMGNPGITILILHTKNTQSLP